MNFLQAQDIVAAGQAIQHRATLGALLPGNFTVLSKADGNLKIRNNKGNPRTVKEADWDEVVVNLKDLRERCGSVSRNSMKTRNSTYVLSIIGLWEDRGHRFIS